MGAIWLGVISDLFVNLSAGWFRAAIVVPIYTKRHKIKPWTFTMNIIAGIITLVAAVAVRGAL